MSMNEKKVPKRRFKEFQNADNWEQRKLSEVYQNIGNAFVGTATPYYVSNGYFYLESNNVKDGQINRNVEIFINEEFYQKQKNKWLHTGDIVMVQSGHVGHAAVIPENLDNTAAHALIMFKNPKIKIEPYFLNYQYQTIKSKKKIDNITVGNTIKHILASDIKDFMVDLPEFEEQTKIAEYFINLDNLITLHQHKLDKLKSLKKAYLTDMFPAEGESKPKLRFAGFTDDWEQCKVKEIFKVTRGNVLAATKTSESITANNLYPVYSSQTKDNGLMGYYKEYLFDTAITWTTDGANAGTVRFREGKFYCTNVCGVLLSESGYANQMVSEALNLIAWKYVSKVGNPKLMNNIMSEIQVTLPKSIGEQIKIASYFQQLDNLITLHQRKLEKLQNIKKAYLSEMFI